VAAEKANMKTRKQVYDLTLEDFAEFPVWEFALDEEGEERQDEATVRPYVFTLALDPHNGSFVVQTEFLLSDGTRMKGYLSPAVESKEIGYVQPVIIVEKSQIGFWSGLKKPSAEEISSYYQTLGKTSEEVFPVRYKSIVELLGGSIEGRIVGFLYYSSDMKVQVIK
jgi:hypothetical protein